MSRAVHRIRPITIGWLIISASIVATTAAGQDLRETLYRLTNDSITQQAYLKASNTNSLDGFGVSVAISGDTVVVGAIYESSNATGVNGNQGDGAFDSGAAYVFTIVPCPTLADMNCDCAVDALDEAPFVQALLDPAGYAAAYPACNILHADMQPNGFVDGADVQEFVNLLTP